MKIGGKKLKIGGKKLKIRGKKFKNRGKWGFSLAEPSQVPGRV